MKTWRRDGVGGVQEVYSSVLYLYLSAFWIEGCFSRIYINIYLKKRKEGRKAYQCFHETNRCKPHSIYLDLLQTCIAKLPPPTTPAAADATETAETLKFVAAA